MFALRQAVARVVAGPTSRQEAPANLAADPQRCPLTGVAPELAVRAPDGQVYDEGALARWQRSHGRNTYPSGRTVDAQYEPFRDQAFRDLAAASADDASEALVDPITCSEFEDPVVASDGRTYDRSTLETLLRDSGRSPYTREALKPYGYRNGSIRARLGLGDAEPVVDLSGVRSRTASPPRYLATDTRTLVGELATAMRQADAGVFEMAALGTAGMTGAAAGAVTGSALGATAGLLMAPIASLLVPPAIFLALPLGIAGPIMGGMGGAVSGAVYGAQQAAEFARPFGRALDSALGFRRA